MIITIHGKNLEITEVITNAVEKSLARLARFKKFIKPDTRAKVEIRSYPEKIYKISVSINLLFSKHLQAEIKDPDLYIAIKRVINPLTQQLNHLKTQNENKHFVSVGKAILENDEKVNSDYIIEEFEANETSANKFDDYNNQS